jgi:hypothetical protein
MTRREAALLDHAYADGMRAALAMAGQGAEDKAREIADRMMLDALHVLHPDGEEENKK